MNEQNINLKINNYELLAPLISASLVNAIYQRANLVKGDQPLDEKIESSIAEVIALWTSLSATITQTTKELFSNQNKK